MYLFYGTCLLLALVICELVFIKFAEKHIPWREIVSNLNSGHIVLWVFRGVEVICYAFIYNHLSLDLFSSVAPWILWVITFFLWDFTFYWLHRIHHKYSTLWKVHQVHHQGEHFSLSLGIRNSWYSSLTSIPFFIPLAILGITTEMFVLVGAIHYFIQFYNHNRVIRNSGWLESFLITPSHHRVHHGLDKVYLNKNFGGTFVIWDKMFGTFQKELKNLEEKYGLNNHIYSDDVLKLNNDPFIERNNFHVAVFENKKPKISDYLIAIGAFSQFTLLLDYIRNDNSWSSWQLIIAFLIISMGTISLGKLVYSERVWLFINVLFSILLPAFFLLTFSHDFYSYFLFSFNAIYSVVLTLSLLRNDQ